MGKSKEDKEGKEGEEESQEEKIKKRFPGQPELIKRIPAEEIYGDEEDKIIFSDKE